MNQEVTSIQDHLLEVLEGKPWFGRPVFAILDEIQPSRVFERPFGKGHSLADLIYHMNTWAGFVLKRLEKDPEMDLVAFEKQDWRKIDPAVHSWSDGINEFKSIHAKIIDILKTKEDPFLNEIVDHRKYDFRFLLNGLIEHDIYHLGQLAYLKMIFS